MTRTDDVSDELEPETDGEIGDETDDEIGDDEELDPVDVQEATSALCHDVLLALAGRAPDDLLATAREWLAQERFGDVARSLTFAILSYRVPVDEASLLGLADLLAVHEIDHAPLRQAQVAEWDAPTQFLFRSSQVQDGQPDQSELAPAAVAVVEQEEHGVRGVWRSWRYAADGSPWPPPRPVHVVEVAEDAHRPPVAAAFGAALHELGDPHPQVEVVRSGAQLASYQRAAQYAGALVWASTPDPGVEVAQLFDHVEEGGEPAFAEDRPRIEDRAQVQQWARYLDQGAALLVTTAQGADVLDAERGEVVPMTFRTDGTWIWSDALTYYLREHHVRPQDAFAEHLARVSDQVPHVDGVDLHRASAVLMA